MRCSTTRCWDNPLSANVVDICPVGALTDRDFRFKVRVGISTKSIDLSGAAQVQHQCEAIRIGSRALNRGSIEAVNSIGSRRGALLLSSDLAGGERFDHADDSPRRRPGANDLGKRRFKPFIPVSKRRSPWPGFFPEETPNEEAFFLPSSVKKLAADYALEVFTQERELTQVQKILMRPRIARQLFVARRAMGVSTNGGFDALMQN